MIRRIDPIGRGAFGALCVAGMSALAVPVLLVAGAVAGLLYALDGEGLKGLLFGLASLTAAIFAAGLFLAIFFTAWPMASDWIMEWPGYATGFAVGGGGLALMALLLFVLPVPIYVALAAPLLAAFAVGFGIADRLAGLGAPAAQPRKRARTLRRR